MYVFSTQPLWGTVTRRNMARKKPLLREALKEYLHGWELLQSQEQELRDYLIERFVEAMIVVKECELSLRDSLDRRTKAHPLSEEEMEEEDEEDDAADEADPDQEQPWFDLETVNKADNSEVSFFFGPTGNLYLRPDGEVGFTVKNRRIPLCRLLLNHAWTYQKTFDWVATNLQYTDKPSKRRRVSQ